MEKQRKGILVVSFGTTHEDTRIRSIESIENRIKEAFPEYQIYRAWTSNKIRAILKKRDQIGIDSIPEALERMKAEGITEVIVQPTHVINGFETDSMRELIRPYQNSFADIRIGTPLLSSQEDMDQIVAMLAEKWNHLSSEEAVVLMGHGTEHYVNTVYAALDYQLKEKGCSQIHVGTVEAYPSIDTVKAKINPAQTKKVYLSPFMIVAGDHAKNDMAGEDDDSWKSQFEKMGLDVECQLSGLGELDTVQKMFVKHVRDVE